MTIDCITGRQIENPVVLPCKHTFDKATVIRLDRCPLDREEFDHFELHPSSAQSAKKITMYFHNFTLRFFDGAQLTFSKWKQANFTFSWVLNQLPKELQTIAVRSSTHECLLEWSPEKDSYILTLSTINGEFEYMAAFQLLISENWARNFGIT